MKETYFFKKSYLSFKSYHQLHLEENEKEAVLCKLMKSIDQTADKKGYSNLKPILSSVLAAFVLLMGVYILANQDFIHHLTNQGKPTEPLLPDLTELGLTLQKESETEWTIQRPQGTNVGKISFISEEEFENRYEKEAKFEERELDDYPSPTTFIRQHIKQNNIAQTLHYYVDRSETHPNYPYVHIQIHTPSIDVQFEEEARKIMESFHLL